MDPGSWYPPPGPNKQRKSLIYIYIYKTKINGIQSYPTLYFLASETQDFNYTRKRERTRGSRLSAINLAIGGRWRIVVLPAPPQYLIRAIRADTRSGQLLGTRMEATLVFLVAVQRPRGLLSGLGYIWI